MAKIDYEKLAAEIIGKVGGTENIHTVSHCATRLRFVLKDRSLANEKELRQRRVFWDLSMALDSFR